MVSRSFSRAVWGVLAAIVSVGVWASTAFANPLVDHGIQRYEAADFEGALAAFASAESGTDLTRDGLVRLLEGRALAHLAMGDQGQMETALVQLASLEPNRQMGRAIPPPLREAFQRIGSDVDAPLSIEASSAPMPGGVRVEAGVRGDGGDLVREVRIAGRSADGDWTEGTGRELSVVAASGESVEYYAVAVGPGGAVLAEHGTEASPLTHDGDVDDGGGVVDLSDDDDDGSLLVPILIGVGAAVVLAVTIIVIVLATSGGQSDDTQFSPPMRSP